MWAVIEKKEVTKYIQKHPLVRERYSDWKKAAEIDPTNAHDGLVINLRYDEEPVFKKRIGDARLFFIMKQTALQVVAFKFSNRGDAYKK